jgi:hypothetical protein
VGSPCQSEADCDTKECSVIAKGTCKASGSPCLTDGQCGVTGPCEIDAAKEIAVCTASCSNEKACPTGAVCVAADADLVGSCRPACKGPGDTDACGVFPDHECLFGQPIAPPASGGAPPTYACALAPKGQTGALCTKGADCSGNLCITNEKATSGYCSSYCGVGKPACPFGTTCAMTGISFCQKMCTSEFDCPPLMACTPGANTPSKVCQLP